MHEKRGEVFWGLLFCGVALVVLVVVEQRWGVIGPLWPGEVYIPAGSFWMGASPRVPSFGPDDGPQHRVTLTHAFALSRTEVTQAEFKAVMGYNPSQFRSCKERWTFQLRRGRCPVENVTWHEALAFCNKRSVARGLPPCFDCQGQGKAVRCKLKSRYRGHQGKDYYLCLGYRLPTEAEWEYAARASTHTPFSTGSCLSSRQANFNGEFPMRGCFQSRNLKEPVAVMGFAPNDWGLYDMHGNVYEWVFDAALRPYKRHPERDPILLGGVIRMRRGGSWASDAQYCRSAYRRRYSGEVGNSMLGFRYARTLR